MNTMTNNEIFTVASHSADYDIVTVPEGVDLSGITDYDNLIQFPTSTNIDLDLGAADTITFTPDEHLNDVITFSDDIDPDKGA